MRTLFDSIKNCDAHHRLIIAFGASLAMFTFMAGWHLPLRAVMSWNAFSGTVLILSWIHIAYTKPRKYLDSARLQDSSRATIFLFVIVAACVSLFAVTYLLGTAKGLSHESLLRHVVLSVVTVIGSWGLTHTMFTLRYAHTYYGDSDDADQPGHVGGLQFPGEKHPDYLDFAYFAFVVGMACQVSDVSVSNRGLRRLVLIHGLLSFAFNTAILALSLNIVSGLLSN